MRDRLRVAALLGLLVLANACANASNPRATTVTDSAGVEIVTNLPGSVEAADAWSLSSEPVVEIGAGADPDVALFRITDVAPLAGGRVAVGTLTPPQALVFERDGTRAATLGREGDGPGEFQSVGSVVSIGADSIAVWDSDRRRVSVFTADGRFARELDLSDVAPLSARSAPDTRTASGITRLLGTSSGALVLFGEGVFGPGPASGVARVELPALRIGRQGAVIGRYGEIPGMTLFHGGPAGAVPLPFGARAYAAASGDAFVVGTAEAPELRVFAASGALERIIRWPDTERALGGPHHAAWRAMVEARPELRELIAAIPLPERFPAYEGLLAGDQGEVLVGDYAGPVGIWPTRRADHGPEMLAPEKRAPARHWLVFDAGGALSATLTTPEGFEPYALRDGILWGVYVDTLEVESVRGYALERS